MRYFRAAVVGIFAVAAAGKADAQTVEQLRALSLEQLGNIEISSVSRRPEPLNEAAAAIFVIGAADIRRSGATSLPEVLRLAPNLEVARLNAFTYTITARGFNSPESSNKLQVLIDGRSVYSPLASTVFWDAVNVDLDDVERIEVVSGPGGTLYGSNAVNGVINVITKNSADTQGLLADIGGGTMDRNGTFRYGGRIDAGTTYRAYGTGFDRGDTKPVSPTDFSYDAFHGGQVGFRTDRTSGQDAYTLQGDLYDHAVIRNVERLFGGNMLGRWTRQLDSGGSLQFQAYYMNDNRLSTGLHDTLSTYDVQVQHNMAVGDHQIVSGVEARAWREGIFTSGPFGFAQPVQMLYLGSVFAQDEYALRPDLKLTVGLKLSDETLAGFDALPNIRLGWQAVPSVFLWSAVSRAVRTPSRIDQQLQSPGFLVPSPNFKSEKLTAFEIGYRGQPFPRTTLSISTYYNLYDDIRSDNFTNGGLPIMLGNGIAGDSYGVEIWGTYAVTDWWRLKPGFSWLHKNLHLKPGNTDISAFQAAGQDPSYQAQLRSEMNLTDTVELDLAVREIGAVSRPQVTSELVPSYLEADARIGWHVTKSVELSLEGTNLVHARHLEGFDPSTTAPRYIPRAVFARVRLQL